MCTKSQLNVNLFPVNTFCGRTRRNLSKNCVKRSRILVFKSSCQHFNLENMGFNPAYRCLLEITKTNKREYFTFPLCK